MNLVPEIDRINQLFLEGMNTKNVALLRSLYADDALYFTNGKPIHRGPEEIARHYTEYLGAGVEGASLEPIEQRITGDTAISTGRFVATVGLPDGTRKALPGKYVVLLRRDAAGAWKIVLDIDNFDEIPPWLKPA